MLPIFRIIANFFMKPFGLVCPLHKCPLKAGNLAAQIGLARQSADYADAQKRLFPYVNFSRPTSFESKFLQHGRFFLPSYPKVFFCPDCRVAEQKWLEEHPIDWTQAFQAKLKSISEEL